MRATDGPPINRGVPIYCPYWGHGCQWSIDTTGQTGHKLLAEHIERARARGCRVHSQPVEKAAA